MKTGIFAKTFYRPTVEGVFQAVRSHHFETVQFNMSCAGLDPMPGEIPETVISGIRSAARGVSLCGVSGTYNMCHPDPAVRVTGLQRLEVLARHCRAIGTDLITLCTGTRNPDDQWAFHPDNNTPAAWQDLLQSMENALLIAEHYDIRLGIEPELSNVVNSARKALQLQSELGSKRMKIILDPGNLFERAGIRQIKRLIDEAIDLLAPDIAMAHAKDRDGTGAFAPPGQGIIPFDYLVSRLRSAGIDVPVVAHGFPEEAAPAVSGYLHRLLQC